MQAKTMIIGISGASASGKSLLANTIVREMGSEKVVVIPEDSYYRDRQDIPFEERCNINYDHPEALEHNLLKADLKKLQAGETVDIPTYDYTKHQRAKETRHIGHHRIIVLEGILLFTDPELRELMDIRIFMDTPLDVCLLRRAKRDILERERNFESVMDQYENTVRPMYIQFIEPSKKFADIIVPRGGENRIAIEMIKAKLREILSD